MQNVGGCFEMLTKEMQRLKMDLREAGGLVISRIYRGIKVESGGRGKEQVRSDRLRRQEKIWNIKNWENFTSLEMFGIMVY